MPKYRAIMFSQRVGAPRVAMFAAPATAIDSWAGVPQRELLEGQETIGFQREENDTRIRHLKDFLSDERNVIQNPLLCAVRDESQVTWTPDSPDSLEAVQAGWLEIADSGNKDLSLRQLFSQLEFALRQRQPALATAPMDPDRVGRLQLRLQEMFDDPVLEPTDDYDPSATDEDSVSGLFDSETHVLEFWQEVKVREQLLGELGDHADQFEEKDEFLGFSRDVLESYLRPVFLVDGQHRLRGAIQAARAAALGRLSEDPAFLGQLEQGVDRESLICDLMAQEGRVIPVSLLIETNTAEHVFQFVVVNQKATPVGKALLGTIVASSLTESELGSVADRLERVGINVTDSQAVSWFTRNRDSPFYRLVQQGVRGEEGNKLPWSVLKDLVSIFRNLKGGRLFHEDPPIDYADKWRRHGLIRSDLVADVYDPTDPGSMRAAYDKWRALDGPWLAVSAAFFTALRDRLADSANPDGQNGWGSTRSNLFNKVSLWILVADFFQYLTDREITIDNPSEVVNLVEQWLSGVDRAYFNRNWNLSGIKKDTPGIRAQWSSLWVAYRKDPGDLRRVANSEFRKSRAVGG